MSDILEKGLEEVRSAERALRELMQTAVEQGQYDRVTILARWAEQLSQIGGNGVSVGEADVTPTAQNQTASSNHRTIRSNTKRKTKYPIFKRSGDNLVKVAWSKSSKSEYQHQAPKAIVFALVQNMQNAMNGDALITMDDVLPLSTEDHAEVPSYQSYACLAWLRSIGVVDQHGRQGYSIMTGTEARELIEQGWQELPAVKR